MRLHAYVLAADPWWLKESVQSYSDHVDRIVVSYDETHTSWTGTPIPVDKCLALLAEIDPLSKLVYRPGRYARLEHHPLENETFQRQCALDAAGDGADWVLQVDTDEVFASWPSFLAALQEADARGFGGVDYPARSFYQRLGPHRYLEDSRRWWRIAAGYPGAIAVRPGTVLSHCRQAGSTPLYRVDFSHVSTDPARSRKAPVHHVISKERAIMHYAWIRDMDYMLRKAKWSGHANQRNWKAEIEHWEWSKKHPYRAVAGSPLRELTYKRRQPWLRIASDLPVELPRDAVDE
jgi:hypothetical protein